ncbi:hypothetical protein CEXT_646091 [Caerostris extrusa]|uniref:Uncharacterized protein n=1 Tax=Caerostris extrusa TaxID=172846 RepID=A0AAV4UJ54_CAEEX|nr:hypothetical protein CEXT_646091 [Caerostris extrusa]
MATTDIRQCKHIRLMSVEKATNSVWTTSAGWSPLTARESIEPIDGPTCQWSSGLMGWTPTEGKFRGMYSARYEHVVPFNSLGCLQNEEIVLFMTLTNILPRR